MPKAEPSPSMLPEVRQVMRRRDDQDVPDARQHQHRQRIIDHRLVVDRQQLLGDGEGQRIEPRAAAARKNDSTHMISSGLRPLGNVTEIPDRGDETMRSRDTDARAGWLEIEAVQRLFEVALVAHHMNERQVAEAAHCRKLVIVAVLAAIGQARHHDQRLARFQARQDGAHAGMGDDEIGRANALAGLHGLDEIAIFDVPGLVGVRPICANTSLDFAPPTSRSA